MFVIVKRKMILICLFIVLLIIFCINLIYNFIIVKKEYKIINEKVNNQIKIAHLSDLHGVKNKYQANKMLKIITNTSPDIIVIAGDLVDSNDYAKGKFPTSRTIEFMKNIVKIAPVYYVFGNHEVVLIEDKTENGYTFVKTLEDSGIKIVNNEKDEINVRETKVTVVGLQDPRTVNSYNSIEQTIEEELRFVYQNISGESYKILVSHRPECFNIYSEYDIDLCLTGHAHGGQFRFPLIKGLYAPNQGWFPKYTKGEYNLNNTKMIVSPGLGNSLLKFRIFNPLEINIIYIEK